MPFPLKSIDSDLFTMFKAALLQGGGDQPIGKH